MWPFVSSAPLTYVWLIVLLITTIIQHSLSRGELHTLLVHQSTNIHELATDPLEVAMGHFSAIFIGLLFHPMVNPAKLFRPSGAAPKSG